jgi:ketosteroid isomerase-like protein
MDAAKKRLALSALCLVIGVPLSSASAQTRQAPPSGVETLVTRFKASEKSNDGIDRASLFTDDAVVINAWGDRVEGRTAVDDFWKSLMKSGTFSSSVITERETLYTKLADNLWLADYVEDLTGQRGPRSGRELPARIIHMTLIARHVTGDEWLIAYYRAGDWHARSGPPKDSVSQ